MKTEYEIKEKIRSLKIRQNELHPLNKKGFDIYKYEIEILEWVLSLPKIKR